MIDVLVQRNTISLLPVIKAQQLALLQIRFIAVRYMYSFHLGRNVTALSDPSRLRITVLSSTCILYHVLHKIILYT